MAEFILHDFIMKTLEKMKNRVDEYQVRKYALTWYEKEVLKDEDMLTIDGWYSTEETETEEDTENSNSDFGEVTTDTESEEK